MPQLTNLAQNGIPLRSLSKIVHTFNSSSVYKVLLAVYQDLDWTSLSSRFRPLWVYRRSNVENFPLLFSSCGTDAPMATWASLPYEIRYRILSIFSKSIIEDYRYLQKYPHNHEKLYGPNTAADGPYEAYTAALLISHEFLDILNDIEVDGQRPLPWMKKANFEYTVAILKWFPMHARKLLVRPGTKLWDVCIGRK